MVVKPKPNIIKIVKKVSQTKMPGIREKIKKEFEKEVLAIDKEIEKISNLEEKSKIEILSEFDSLIKEQNNIARDIEENLLQIKQKLLDCRTKLSNIPSAPDTPKISSLLIYSEFQKNGESTTLKNFIEPRKNTKAIIQEFCTTNNIPVNVDSFKKNELYDVIMTQIIDKYAI